MSVIAAALVPGMPQLLAAEPAPSWAELAAATREVGDRLRRLDVQAVLLLSTQWFTVLGHQVQCDAGIRGARTDENWYRYDYGHLDYDLRIDVELAQAWADAVDAAGMQARRTRYDGFPIDTGTVTASRLLDPDGRHVAALDARSVGATRLSSVARDREDGAALVTEFRGLVEAHREAGSELAARLLGNTLQPGGTHLARRSDGEPIAGNHERLTAMHTLPEVRHQVAEGAGLPPLVERLQAF